MFTYLTCRSSTSQLFNNRSTLWWYRRKMRQEQQPSVAPEPAPDAGGAPGSGSLVRDDEKDAVLVG